MPDYITEVLNGGFGDSMLSKVSFGKTKQTDRYARSSSGVLPLELSLRPLKLTEQSI